MQIENALSTLTVSLLLAITTSAAAEPPDAGQADLVFTGKAYDLDAEVGDPSALIYTEQHRQTGICESGKWTPAKDSVSYLQPSGEERGSKVVDYTVALQRPSYTMLDHKFDERIEVTNDSDERALVYYDEYEEPEIQRYEVPLEEDSVINAGFDQLVVKNWNDLMEGETISFDFVAVPRGEAYDFEATKVESSRSTKGDNVIRIQPAGFFTDFFVEPIYLAYNDEGYITDYIGLGNVRKDSNENYRVHIRYDYQEKPSCPGRAS